MRMKLPVIPSRHAHWLALVCGLACAPATPAEGPPFLGRWQLDEPVPAQAAYTALHIKGTSLAWRGPGKSSPACTHRFALKPEPAGTTYRNGRGTQFVAGVAGSLPTYLLAIQGSDCASPVDAVRISYPLVYDVRHIEVIEYAGGKPVSARRMHRAR